MPGHQKGIEIMQKGIEIMQKGIEIMQKIPTCPQILTKSYTIFHTLTIHTYIKKNHTSQNNSGAGTMSLGLPLATFVMNVAEGTSVR